MGSRSMRNHTMVNYNQEKVFSGFTRLLQDLESLLIDKDSCDVIFVIGKEESQIFAHSIILKARCSSFHFNNKRAICKITDTIVNTATNGIITIKWPKANAEVFRQVLHYIYTGEINLNEIDVLETLIIAYELGLDELRDPCEENIISSLCVSNACLYLSAALSLEERIADKKKAAYFIERCTNYAIENASECIKTNGFLKLSKNALIYLVSSDYLALDEEDVWRAVLSWARHQTGINHPMSLWTEEDKSLISQQLSGVINHVRILLIDSQVFAQEVEPSGAVPMEISLERYRFAALGNKFIPVSGDKRFEPRTTNKLFKGSILLYGDKTNYQRILNNWYGIQNQAWKLIFRASIDGYSSSDFHRKCDGVSPTFTVIKGHNDDLCGGFTNIPWTTPSDCKGKYFSSEKSFIFSLSNSKDLGPCKFDVVKKKFAVLHHQSLGPCFGAGADLYISNECNNNRDSYTNLPHSYNGEHASTSILMGDYNFYVKDYEVFTINR